MYTFRLSAAFMLKPTADVSKELHEMLGMGKLGKTGGEQGRVYLICMHPPGAGDYFGVPCLAAANACGARLRDAVRRHCAHMNTVSATEQC
jgi:hypothetical protein